MCRVGPCQPDSLARVVSTSRTSPPPLHCCRHFTGDPVTSMPDVTELALHDGDEFLVVASDGLWDVLDSQVSHAQMCSSCSNASAHWRSWCVRCIHPCWQLRCSVVDSWDPAAL